MDTIILCWHFFSFLVLLSYERNITLVILISEKDKTRIVNTLFKVKLLDMVGQLAAFQNGTKEVLY